MTVCDPAVGSGAFPVGMMQEILLLKRGLEQSTDVRVDIGGQRVAEWKQHIITNSLFGVDINPEAVEICHLRLWLSLVIDANEPVPLPNLDFRFVAGDSLVDRIGTESLPESLPKQVVQKKLGMGTLEELPELEKEIRSLREQFTQTSTPSQARELRERIKKKQVGAVRLQIEAIEENHNAALKEAKRELSKLERMGGTRRAITAQERKVEELEEKIASLKELKGQLDPWAPYKKPCLWPVEFPEVFDAGGFDIVVANPPYVRQESLSSEDQSTYEAGFKETFEGTADLYVYFYQRAVQILGDHGHVAFITSNSFTKRSYGQKLQRFLVENLTILRVIDFGELRVFDATVEPLVLVARREHAGLQHQVDGHQLYCVVSKQLDSARGTVSSVREVLEDLNTLLERDHSRLSQNLLSSGGWRLEQEDLIHLAHQILSKGIPLGVFSKGKIYYGLKTGLNQAFVLDNKAREVLARGYSSVRRFIRPWFRGQDIRKWNSGKPVRYLIAIRNSSDESANNIWDGDHSETKASRLFSANYPSLFAHFRRFEKPLRSRSDQGKYWWELRPCAYYHEFQRSKIIWPDIARESSTPSGEIHQPMMRHARNWNSFGQMN